MANIKKSKLLNLFERVTSPLSANQVLKELKLTRDNKRAVRGALRHLVSEGKINKIKGGKFQLNNNNSNSPKRSNDKSNNQKPKINVKADTKILGDLLLRENNLFLVPRNDEFPVFKVNNLEKSNASIGDLVVAKSLENKENGYFLCDITKNLGKSGEVKAEKEALLIHHNLNKTFPKNVRDESQSIPDTITINKNKKRVDLTNETIFTIDGEDAKDFDDAVGIKKAKSGYKLWVSIADVSSYVKIGSPLDKEAVKRATSTYLADSVVPMLPEKLSNNLCSLVPNEIRLTKTAEINFDLNGNLKGYKLYNSFIKSSARLTYNWVSDVLAETVKTDKDNKEVVSKIKLMHELYTKLKKIRVQKGELQFDFPEPNIMRDSDGNVENIQKSKRNIAHGIIEEFMIAANGVAAEFIFKNDVPSIYRIHEKPDEAAIQELKKELSDLGLEVDIDSDVKPKDIQSILRKANKRNDSDFISMMVLRSLQKAVYSTKHIPHFGLAIDDYTHFTSPIRRYPDLIVHRILDTLLSKSEPQYNIDQLNKIAEDCSIKERKAEKIERESVNLECAFFMKDHIGSTFNAKAISIHPFGVFVELEDYFVEGLIPKTAYRGKGKKRIWFELGDKVSVKLVEADIKRRRLTFEIA